MVFSPKIYLVLIEAELIWFVLIISLDAFFLATIFVISYVRINNFYFLKFFNFKISKKLLKESLPIIPSVFIVLLYMRVDQLMINEILGSYQLGIYSSAVRVSEIFNIIPTLIMVSLFPSIITLRKKNIKEYNKRFQILFTFLVWLAIFISIFITVFSYKIILILFGIEFINASSIIKINIWSTIFVFLTISSGRKLISENKSIKIFYRSLLGLTINLILNYFFIPKYGLEGAAIATFVAWFFTGYFYDFLDKDEWNMFKQKTLAFLGKLS